MSESKQYEIPKRVVIEAYKRVKANKGSAGIDGVDFEIFEKRLNNNLYKIWNRMSSGSYIPSPVLAVEIPKKAGGTRRLGIPTIADRIAQMVARMYVEPVVEPMFSEDSYGYRPNKSAIDAIESTRNRCWRYDYVIELDVKGLFDNIDHELLMRVVERHVKEKWVCLYIKRWLETPFVTREGQKIERTSGTPQGGVISPVLANMFLHYVFDMWMIRNFPKAPFERYADDGIIHCRTKEEELTEFDFLGYTFKAVYIKCKDGKIRHNFIASVSKASSKNFREKIKAMEVHKKTGCKIEIIAEMINPLVRGWMNYFGKFNPSAMRGTLQCIERRIVKWAMCKYKNFRGRRCRAEKWLCTIRKREPKLFAHWSILYSYC